MTTTPSSLPQRHALPLLILLIGAAFRLWALDSIPPGLQHDEVFHAHDAFTVRQGNLQLWFTSNAGNEPLYLYLMALTTATIGDHALGIRFTALIAGMLTLAFTYRWADQAFGRRPALIAIAFMAVGFWPVWMSRVGLRAVLLPLMAAFTGWLYTRAIDKSIGAEHDLPLQQIRRFALAGVAMGLAFYTYPAAMALPIIFAAFTVYMTIIRRDLLTRTWRGQIVFWVVAVMLYAPLAWAINNAGGYLRVQQTALPLDALRAGNLLPILQNTWQTLLMWTTRGDPFWRYNVAERPVFEISLAIVFAIGVVVAGWAAVRGKTYHALIVLTLLLGLIPSIVTDTPPSFLRASAVLPATFIALALGFETLAWGMESIGKRFGAGRYAGPVLMIALLVASGIVTVRDYFVTWANNEEVQRVYRTDLAEIAAYLRTHDTPAGIAISTTKPHDLDPFIFAYTPHGEADIHWYDGLYAMVIPSSDTPSWVFITREPPPPRRLQAILDALPLREERVFPNGALSYRLYEVPPADVFVDRFPPPTARGVWISDVLAFPPDDPDSIRRSLALPVQFGEIAELIGYRAPDTFTAGGWLPIDLHFHVLHDVTAPEPWAIFAHLLDANGNLVAGRDFLAVPPHTWRAGDVFIQLHDVELPAWCPPGVYHLEIGLYTLRDGSRFPLIVGGQSVGDRLLLEPVEIVTP